VTAIRVMIADNDTGQVETLRAALNHGDFEILSVVSARETAIKQLSIEPDIILLNPEILKQRTLSRFIHSVQSKSPSSRVVCVLRDAPSEEDAIADIKAGIRGFIKTTDQAIIIAKALRSVYGGEIWAERRILEKAIANPMLLPETLQAHVPGLPPLTNREMEMLTLVLQGATNREIADRSKISERTVKTHLYRVYRKLRVKSRTKAIALLSHA
jgi:DNA-binding NarL/FixJ family response regulator